jgi:exopolysaccharide biosynthesis polyprenyl glycosylphosphotransferase
LVIADLIVLMAMCYLPALISFRWSLPWPAMPAFAVLVTLFGFSEGLYKNAWETTLGEFPILARSVSLAMGLVLVAAWSEMQARAALLTLGTSLAGLLLWRRLLAWEHRHRGTESRNVLIVGASPAGRAIARALREDPLHQTVVRGFVDDYQSLSAEVLGRIEDLDWLARGEFVDEVIVALPNHSLLAREAAQVAYRNHLDIRAVPDLPAGVWPEACIDRIGDVPIVTLHREPLPSAELFLKRLLDTAGALAGLVLAAPVMAAVALLIRLDSPGPFIYAAERTGVKGRRFRCYKFRSMATDADRRKESLRARNQREGPIFKIDDDPRITRVGRFIRRYSLDELPQLWNVLRGEMSLVGPRPHPVDEVRHYELHHYRRLDVKPGLTGLWQITARKCPSFELNMHLDLTYIENWTLLLDLRILMRTVRVLFAAEGA